MNGYWRRVGLLLDRALELEPALRQAFLDRACASDPALRREVESLLAREGRLSGFLEGLRATPDPDVRPDDPLPEDPLVGSRIGGYRVVRPVGRGGMGQVYLAERADGRFERRVAIKVLRPFLDQGAEHRFRTEGRVLARLEHPAIARLLDAGVTPGGRPFLVTEFVDGQPIDRHCHDVRPDLPARLELFRQVAEAVSHAHLNLLVHRDLKPSNILVTPAGRVKLLDFGIAKLLDAPREETGPGDRWLTPECAAPEQIREEAVTTLTDVHQLGGLLYRLLAGRPPFGNSRDPGASRPGTDRMQGSGRHALEREILEVDPPPPLGGSHASVPRALAADLDAIALRALRKEPAERYPSVRAMLDDLDRASSSRPVEARAGTRRYRTARFLRRRRIESAAAAVVAVSVLAGAAAATWQARIATRERDEARAATLRAEEALDRTRELTGLLLNLFHSADPWEGELRDPESARGWLAVAGTRAEDLVDSGPLQAELLEVLARVHLRVDEPDRAEELARRAVTIRRERASHEPGELATALNVLGTVLTYRGRFAEADRSHEEALELQTGHLGPDHPDVAQTLSLLASRRAREDLELTEALHRRALAIRELSLGPDHLLTLSSLRALGRILRVRGRPQEAESYLGRALASLLRTVGPDHPDVARAMLNLADVIRRYQGDDDRAERLYRSALDIHRRVHGDDYPGLTHPIEGLAYIASDRGDHERAETLLREALELRRRVFGPEHPSFAEGLGFLAGELERQGRLSEAEALRRDEVARLVAARGPDHPHVAGALGSLARVLTARGRLDEAEELYLRAMEIRVAAHGDRGGVLGVLHRSLGTVYERKGAWRDAERAYETALALLLEGRTEVHPDVVEVREGLARVRYLATGGA